MHYFVLFQLFPNVIPALAFLVILTFPFYVIPLLDKGICAMFYNRLPGLFPAMTGEIKAKRLKIAENDTAISAKFLKFFYFLN